MAYRVTVRRGSRVERETTDGLEAALAVAEAAAREAKRTERRTSVELRVRTYAPGDQVVARVEIHGGGRRAGVDVLGDGSMTAHTGRIRRTPIALEAGEGALDALRRVLGAQGG